MAIEPYRRLLALPGVRTLLLVGLLARVPSTAVNMTLTLHVAETLDLGFTQVGLIVLAATVGTAVGSPLSGRFVDRYGLRPVLLATTAAQAVFWATAWAMPFPVLLVCSAAAGLLALPVFSVIRQCLAALLPVEQRRTGFSLDSMLVEVSYMTGPALGVAGMTTLGSAWTMGFLAAGLVGSGSALILLNPPTRSAEEMETAGEKVPRRQWLTPGLVTLLGTAAAATFVLTATELSLVAVMKNAGDTAWTGLAIGIWCVYSLIGGFVYGGLPRGLSPLVLIGAMGLLTIPVGLIDGDWWWLVLALVPAGVLCAPGLSSTVEALSRRVPAGARGEAMGLHGTALLIGGAASAPIAGAVIDGPGPGWAFAVAGLVGVVMVLIALPFWRRAASPVGKSEPVAV
ncbi:MFS transporter [Planomonospora venezuelensis]|uniref:MFS family permease n=1 Tax=Planomonospora venezuelensis TaxID=1999 RepID=A0A841D2E9_PLAVE|nr:MFS transporter [Planomonospora venezuelensis]MBB5961686.1 MFS family permease [Planomonospora venezuelensis]GIM98832.1 MFS transporter [Planomonospora venezuelensis]